MPSNTVITLAATILFTTFLASCIYVFGIPPEIKRKLERTALKTMGENKASYMMKSSIDKVPESDQKELNEMKGNVKDLTGGALQNPLGEFAGESADSATSGFTGR